MSKRMLFMLGVLIIATSVIALAAVAQTQSWFKIERQKGVLVGDGRNIIIEPSTKDKLEFAKSIDPVTAKPTGELKNMGVSKMLNTAILHLSGCRA